MNSIIYKKIWPNVKATDLGHSSYSHVFAFALLIVPCVLNFQLRKKQEQTDSVIQNVKPSGHPSTGGRGLRNKRPNRGVEHRLVLLLQWHFSLWVQYTRHVGCFGWFFSFAKFHNGNHSVVQVSLVVSAQWHWAATQQINMEKTAAWVVCQEAWQLWGLIWDSPMVFRYVTLTESYLVIFKLSF